MHFELNQLLYVHNPRITVCVCVRSSNLFKLAYSLVCHQMFLITCDAHTYFCLFVILTKS